MQPLSVSVVVVSFNTKDLLRRCLQSLTDTHEVIVVENASHDGSADMVAAEFPSVRLIRNDRNVGFGAANNQGIETAYGELVLLLNSDACAHPGAIAKLASAFDDPDVVAAGGKLLNPDGSLQNSTANELTLWAVLCEQLYLEKLFPTSRVFSPYWNTRRLIAEGPGPHKTAQVMGACLMFRLNLTRGAPEGAQAKLSPDSPLLLPREEEGPGVEVPRSGADGSLLPPSRSRTLRPTFDEDYFLYCEDTDFCYRLQQYGEIVYVPEAEFTHELGSSSAGTRWTSVARYNRGKELYFAKHWTRLEWFWCLILNRLGALLRALAWLLLSPVKGKRALRQAGLFLRVLIAPIKGPRRPGLG